MNKILATILCTLPVFVGFAWLAPANAQQEEEVEEEKTPLQEGMNELYNGLRTLRKSLKDESRDAESLATLCAMQRGALIAKSETPPLTAKQPADAQAGFVLDYRRQMIAVTRDLLEAENLLLQGKREEARSMLRKVHESEEEGHETFTEDEE